MKTHKTSAIALSLYTCGLTNANYKIMHYSDRITSQPGVMLGKPVIKGTRITVALILRKLAEGAGHEELLQLYPHLKQEDIYAALAYASEVIANEEILLPKAS